MSRMKTWMVAGALLGAIGCGDDPPAPTPPVDAGTDANVDDTGKTPDNGPQPDVEPPACDMGQMRCSGACVDTQTNNANCGACGTACTGAQFCRAGTCQTDMMCTGAQTLCGTACTDTSSDATNCGTCGNACAAGQTCMGGSCRATEMCAGGQTSCMGTCVDTATDANNCGACGTVCGAGAGCMAGSCRAITMCPTGQTACGGVCVDTMTDSANCGMCGTSCGAMQACAAGMCSTMTCGAGEMLCGSRCANTVTDAANCGGCGRACATGQTCVASLCVGTSMCPTGQTSCGVGGTAVCADLNADPANCGACGRACAAGQSCTAGTCGTGRMMCPTGQTDCAPMAPAPTCVDTATSAANCGSCGNACPTGSTCVAGACACPAGQALCGGACVNTQTSAANCGRCGNACPMGQGCAAGACGCPTGQAVCAGACVNTQTDASNCGACGTACPTGQACAAGRCGCAAGQMLCGTACVNVTTDRANCGRCGNVCGMGQSCAAGACACPAGQTSCGTGAAAVCADLMTSAAHCGTCTTVCPAGVPCMGGMCRGTPPANDTRAGATVITLSAGAAQDLAANTTSARPDTTGTCACTSGNDVFFRFTLTVPEYVYADTLGAPFDTALFLQDAGGNNLSAPAAGQVTCNDDANSAGLCGLAGSLQSQIAARLNPGSYFLVLSGCAAGAATIHFQHLPAGTGANARLTVDGTQRTVMGATTGTGSVTSTCCSGGPENSYWWVTCPGQAAATFYASTCNATTGANAANYDVELAQSSALRPTASVSACNDDVGFVCSNGASMSSTVPATTATQAGLNTLLADSCAGMGTYTVRYVLANCAAGTSRCGAACVDTNVDETNCGGCDRRCPAAQTCVRGACQLVRAGETRDNPIPIASGAGTTTVNTTAFRNDTTGVCGCTAGNDVFYAFTVPAGAPQIVYADTVGSAYDTSLFFQTAAGVNVTAAGLANGTTCNDDGGLVGCATGTQSQVMAQLNPGSYLLVLSGCGTGGAANVRFQMVAAGSGAVRALNAGASVVTGTTAGTGRVTSTCCSGGPEDTFYWYTCPAFAGGTFAASTCGRATWDTELAEVSPGRAAGVSCNDDACGPRQSVLSGVAIPRGAGLHAFYVDGCGAASGAYTASVTRP